MRATCMFLAVIGASCVSVARAGDEPLKRTADPAPLVRMQILKIRGETELAIENLPEANSHEFHQKHGPSIAESLVSDLEEAGIVQEKSTQLIACVSGSFPFKQEMKGSGLVEPQTFWVDLKVDVNPQNKMVGVLETRTYASERPTCFTGLQAAIDLTDETFVYRSLPLAIGGEIGTQPRTFSVVIIISPMVVEESKSADEECEASDQCAAACEDCPAECAEPAYDPYVKAVKAEVSEDGCLPALVDSYIFTADPPRELLSDVALEPSDHSGDEYGLLASARFLEEPLPADAKSDANRSFRVADAAERTRSPWRSALREYERMEVWFTVPVGR